MPWSAGRPKSAITAFAAAVHVQPPCLAVGQDEQLLEPAQLGQQLERRRVDGVALEVAQEVGVLLQDDDVDAGPGQQHAEHHPGRAAAGDAAGDLHRRRMARPSWPVKRSGGGQSPGRGDAAAPGPERAW